jgi:hypothetical protein
MAGMDPAKISFPGSRLEEEMDQCVRVAGLVPVGVGLKARPVKAT